MRNKENQRLLIINWQDWTHPLSGGAEVHIYEIFSRLAFDFDITLLCSNYKNAPAYEELGGIKIYRIGSRNTFNLFVPFVYKALTKANNFDLVIEDLNKIPFFGRLYIKEKKIAIMHHLFGKVIFMETNPVFGSYVYFSEKLIPKFYHDIPIVAVSYSTRDDLIRRGIPGNHIEVIYNGVDLKHYYQTKNLYDKPTIVALGRLKKYKRMDILIDSLPEVKKGIPNLRVLIVGSGEHLPYLKTLAKNKGIEDIIEFKGFISENEKKEILSKSWVAVNTSPKEGWGLTSIEAQASGTPSIVPDSPGLLETVKDGETGYIYPYGDRKALASIIIDLLKDKEKVLSMGEEARRWASNFSWDTSADRMKKFIKEII